VAETTTPWQLRMFRKTLKKQMRLRCLRKHLGSIGPGERCNLITCGDNNGAMNYCLRELGGQWSWTDLEETCIEEISQLLGEEVRHGSPDHLPWSDSTFDRVVTIDVHEHLPDPAVFTREVSRIAKPGAQVIMTVPNGDESKIAVRIKHAVGMTKEHYGHVRVGLQFHELEELMLHNRIEPRARTSFSRFFTEMLELTINFVYVKVLAKRSSAKVEVGQIAPATQDQLRSVEKIYKAYSVIYPLYWLVSKLDNALFFTEGYVVMVEGRRAPAS
jgi:SAM-dependent methyltransferase